MDYPEPIKYYLEPPRKALTFHLLDVGEGQLFLVVFPDETTMLIDCNVREAQKDEIINYLGSVIPWRYDKIKQEWAQWIDIFVNSHRDFDHYCGLSEINKEFKVKSIWDSGQTGATTQDSDYEYYMSLRRSLTDTYGEQAVLIPRPSLSPITSFGDAKVYCLSSSEEFLLTPFIKEYLIPVLKAKIQHTNAIVLSIHYAGRSILIASDSDWKAWKEKIVPNFGSSGLLKSDILVASHHGSRSFFTEEQMHDDIDVQKNPNTTYVDSITCIQPSITLIPCGDYEIHHHPNAQALKIYKDNTAHRQVYTTHEKGTLVGYIDEVGHWTVCPSRFNSNSNSKLNFSISCKAEYNGINRIASSGQDFPLDSHLAFNVESRGGVIEPFESVKVLWEVSNAGINEHDGYQDIYYKSDSEKTGKLGFGRTVSYEGRHLLRCKLTNNKKGISITKIFVVNGVKP